MKDLGKTLFWLGFSLIIGIVLAYIIVMIIDVTCLGTWVTAISVLGITLIGGLLMLFGRDLERKAGDDV
ncbi:MAG: hypothetical protein Q4C34_03380 [Bacteroidales bacterium]|nr:hypothetical protein [Bacteroidales bacterium]